MIPRREYDNIGILNDSFLIGGGVGPHQLQLWFPALPCPAPKLLRISSYTCEWIHYGVRCLLCAAIVSIEIVVCVCVHQGRVVHLDLLSVYDLDVEIVDSKHHIVTKLRKRRPSRWCRKIKLISFAIEMRRCIELPRLHRSVQKKPCNRKS